MRFGRILYMSVLTAALAVVSSPNAHASAILVLSDTSGGSVSCNNSLAFSATNCSAATGFTTVANGSFISFTGVVGGYTILAANIGGNQPGLPIAGNVLSSTFNVLHAQGAGNLQIDYGGNNFGLPVGPGLLLSGSASGTWGQSQAADAMNFQVWARDDNALIIPGGAATAIALGCVPGAGLTTSCSTATPDVPFLRGAGFYSLTARQTVTQSSLDTLGANYGSSVAATPQVPEQVPEPASLLLIGAGLTGFALWRRRSD